MFTNFFFFFFFLNLPRMLGCIFMSWSSKSTLWFRVPLLSSQGTLTVLLLFSWIMVYFLISCQTELLMGGQTGRWQRKRVHWPRTTFLSFGKDECHGLNSNSMWFLTGMGDCHVVPASNLALRSFIVYLPKTRLKPTIAYASTFRACLNALTHAIVILKVQFVRKKKSC